MPPLIYIIPLILFIISIYFFITDGTFTYPSGAGIGFLFLTIFSFRIIFRYYSKTNSPTESDIQ